MPPIRRQLVTAFLLTVSLIVVLGVAYPAAVWAIGQLGFNHKANGSLLSAQGRTVGSSLIGQDFTDKNGKPLRQYFQPRPSAAGNGYDPTSSGASNLGPSNPKLIGFVPGVNTVDLNGNPSKTNPFATAADPYCVPTDPKGNPVTSPSPGQAYAKNKDGGYVCYSSTVPERVLAYRQEFGLPPNAKVPVDAVTASGSGLDPDISEANALDQAPTVAAARHVSASRVIALVHAHVHNRTWNFLGENTVNVLDLNLALDQLG